jgi:hypothetical protein
MKIHASIMALLFIFININADTPKGFHQHDGFYLSMNLGLVLGDINIDATGAYFSNFVFSGVGTYIPQVRRSDFLNYLL